jgi:hypothetical protein
MSHGAPNNDSAGIWMGGGGPSYGPNSVQGGDDYIYFTTANGVYDYTTNWGDSFIRMYNNPTGGSGGTPVLQISDWFTPGDQFWRANKNNSVHSGCSPDGDVDFGSGGVMLIPDNENSTNISLAVSGDKEGGIWFVNRANPGEGGTSQNCTGSSNTNTQTYPINGTSFANETGPLIHYKPSLLGNRQRHELSLPWFVRDQLQQRRRSAHAISDLWNRPAD